jgi:hypothetical protein
MVVITKDRVMAGKRLVYCIFNEWDMYEWVLERMNGSYALHDINGGGGQGESFERDASIGTSDCQITIRWPSPIQRRCLLFLTAVP